MHLGQVYFICILVIIVLPVECPIVSPPQHTLEQNYIVGRLIVHKYVHLFTLLFAHLTCERNVLEGQFDDLLVSILCHGFLGHYSRSLDSTSWCARGGTFASVPSLF